MNWEFALASEIGSRKKQQDRIAVFTSQDGSSSLAVLADGLGGHSDGGKAAQIDARMLIEILIFKIDDSGLELIRDFVGLRKTPLAIFSNSSP